MRRTMLALGITAALTTACSQTSPSAPTSTTPTATTATPAQLPPDPQPASAGPCPYLTDTFVANANGQRVSKVQTSADKPHPTCFFYALTGELQLTVRVYSGDPSVAKALVDKAAPVDTSNPADRAGWRGGYQSTEGGAVYAVAKSGAAIIVTSNQKLTVKARTVAEQVIAALAL
jgi:UPF0176 protein